MYLAKEIYNGREFRAIYHDDNPPKISKEDRQRVVLKRIPENEVPDGLSFDGIFDAFW